MKAAIGWVGVVGLVLTVPVACSEAEESAPEGDAGARDEATAGAGSDRAEGGARADSGLGVGGAAGGANGAEPSAGGESGVALGAGGGAGEATQPTTPLVPHAPIECPGFSTGESYVMNDGEILPRKASCSANNCAKFSGEEKELCCDVTAQMLSGCSSYDSQQFKTIEDYCYFAVLYHACISAEPKSCTCASGVRACQAIATTTPPIGICEGLVNRRELAPGPAVYVQEYVLDPVGSIATDPKTGLVWQRKLIKNGKVPNGLYALAQAQTFCSTIDLPGTGWRVPTREEGLTIVRGQAPPYIEAVVFPDTPASKFWTTTTTTDTPPLNYYVIDHAFGRAVIGGVPDNSFSVRCVRSPQ